MLKKIGILLVMLLIAVSVLTVIGCSSSSTATNSSAMTTVSSQVTTLSTDAPTITTQDANDLIAKNKNNANFVLLDVRTADEFNGGHIEGAVNIDYYAADFKANISKLDKTKQYVVYCRTGIHGAASVKIMLDLGFKQAQNMAGGITKWMNDGYPTVK